MYRPDLDGLRAVAVMLVIVFHLGAAGLSGGFLGVDVFFVLSGYFITSQIADKLNDGNFTFSDFYARRIRRILPALIVVLSFTTLAAVLILLPQELASYARTLISAVLSFSNIVFSARLDYFAAPAEREPLLHTWSLSVEDQFYLILPACLFLFHRYARAKLIPVLVAASLASLLFSCWVGISNPNASFYLLPFRAWELLVGALLALHAVPDPLSIFQRRWAGAIGVAIIAASAVLLHDGMGIQALVPLPAVIGTAMIIWSGKGESAALTAATTLLALRPVVFVGRISYGLYLWHWPLIVFARLLWPDDFSALLSTAILALTFVCAIASWAIVEQPIRRQVWGWTRGKSLAAAAATAIAAIVLSGTAARSGLPARLSPLAAQLAQGTQDFSPYRKACHRRGRQIETVASACILGTGETLVTVFSDSHGVELAAALSELPELRVRALTTSSCSAAGAPGEGPLCGAIARATLAELVAQQPSTIVLTAAFSFRSGDRAFWQGFETSVATLVAAGNRVIVVGDVPPFPSSASMPLTLARRALLGFSVDGYEYSPSAGAIEAETEIRLLSARREVEFVALAGALCPASRCTTTIDGAPILFDNHHMSLSAARHFVKSSGLQDLLRRPAQNKPPR